MLLWLMISSADNLYWLSGRSKSKIRAMDHNILGWCFTNKPHCDWLNNSALDRRALDHYAWKSKMVGNTYWPEACLELPGWVSLSKWCVCVCVWLVEQLWKLHCDWLNYYLRKCCNCDLFWFLFFFIDELKKIRDYRNADNIEAWGWPLVVLNCINFRRHALHHISSTYIASTWIASHFIAIHWINMHCIVFHRHTLHQHALHRISSPCIASYFIAWY